MEETFYKTIKTGMRILLALLLGLSSSWGQTIALTFDDAPTSNGPLFSGAERTSRILAHLKKHNVRQAAFFVMTKNLDGSGIERLKLYAAAGHLLGNHTHQHERIAILGTRNYIEDIRLADSLLRPLPGYSHFFRYPFLDEGKTKPVRDSIRSALDAMQLRHGYVTIDNYDWYINSLLKNAVAAKKNVDLQTLRDIYVEHIWESIVFYDNIGKKNLNRSPAHVLLLHENDLAACFLGDLIEHIKKQGWSIISVEEAYRDPIATTIPDVLFNGQGRVASIANEQGVKPVDLVQESEDEVYLEKLLNDKNVFK
jgi:peptidoglycan-N-acetylglucosamine deacetylase